MQQDGFVILSFSNSCEGEIRAAGGRILTSKQDRENHGFGLANIRRAIEGYGGEMSWRAGDGEFTLTLLFQRAR